MTTDPIEEVRQTLSSVAPRAAVVLLAAFTEKSEEDEPSELIVASLAMLPRGSIRGKNNTRIVTAIGLLVSKLPDDLPQKTDLEQLYRQARDRVQP